MAAMRLRNRFVVVLLLLMSCTHAQTPKTRKPRASRPRIEDGINERVVWLNDDVRWIIMPEEHAAFQRLQNDEERDNFIEQFWTRRDPTPDTEENEMKDQHYRRLFYANEQFGEKVPGRMTDRGRAYVRYGHPDSRESLNAADGTPIERWRYRYIEGIGQEQILEFRDACGCGEYKLVSGPSELPGESGIGDGPRHNQTPIPISQLYKPPAVRFKDLEEIVSHHIQMKLVPFGVRVDYANVTPVSDLVPVTISLDNKDLNWREENGQARMSVNIFGRLSALTGRIAQTFEDALADSVPVAQLPERQHQTRDYWKVLPLRPGRYRLDIVVKDVNADKIGTWSRGIVVPEFPAGEFAVSPVVMASELATPRKVFENFVLGNSVIHPRVPSGDDSLPVFRAGEKTFAWFQVYGLTMDEKGSSGPVGLDYSVVDTKIKKKKTSLLLSDVQERNNEPQMTIRKELPLAGLPPGNYELNIKIVDQRFHVAITQKAGFSIR
jgi:GWxTD domain-containing protein